MAAMAMLTQPLAGAVVPLCSGGGSSVVQQASSTQAVVGSSSCKQSSLVGWKFRQQQVSAVAGSRGLRKLVAVRATASEEGLGSAAGAGGDSIVSEVAVLAEEPETEGVGSVAAKARKTSPLQKGGTLDGKDAEGKDPAAATLGKSSPFASLGEGKFDDPRWRAGTWDITQFTKDGKVDWDAVIDAEVVRRKWLEDNPEASSNEEPVVFDTSTVPWWAWVKRFHLPEAELLNGRAAMLGYASGYLVDAATGVGLVDQQNSFFGKLLLFITVLGVLLVRKNSDVANLRNLAQESTYYDKQWQATWKDAKDPEKPDSL